MNKVKYGLSNVHIWPITKDDDKETTYGELIRIQGAVSISFKAEGSQDPFYADNVAYHVISANNGYSGSLEIALIPDEFLTQILSMKINEQDGVLTETADDKNVSFAMAFQFEGDKNAIRHIFYKCSATRPAIEGETIADKVEPKTDNLEFSAIPRISDKKVRSKIEPGKPAYDSFFTKPYQETKVL